MIRSFHSKAGVVVLIALACLSLGCSEENDAKSIAASKMKLALMDSLKDNLAKNGLASKAEEISDGVSNCYVDGVYQMGLLVNPALEIKTMDGNAPTAEQSDAVDALLDRCTEQAVLKAAP